MLRPAPALRPGHAALLATAALALVASCATPSAPVLAAIETRSQHPTSYEAHLAPGAVRLIEVASLDGESPLGEFDAEIDAPTAPGPSTTYVDVQARIVRMDSPVAEALLGWPPHDKRAIRVDRLSLLESLDALVAQGVVDDLSAPRLMVLDGQRGSISVVHQLAYVHGFEVKVNAGVLLADPVVAVADDGMMLLVRPRLRDDDAIDLEVEIVAVKLEQPIADRQVLVPGAISPVSIQLPVSSHQRLATVAPLGEDDCLIVGGLPDGGADSFLFAVLTAQIAGEPRIPDSLR